MRKQHRAKSPGSLKVGNPSKGNHTTKELYGSYTHGSMLNEPGFKHLGATAKEIYDGFPHKGAQDKHKLSHSTDGVVANARNVRRRNIPPKRMEGPDSFGKEHHDEFKKGGSAKWIQGAIKHPGALHKSLGIPEGKRIPESKLITAEHSKNPLTRKRAVLAETLSHMHHNKSRRGR